MKLTSTVILGGLLFLSGCSTMSGVTGRNWDRPSVELAKLNGNVSTKEKVVFNESKAYVAYIGAKDTRSTGTTIMLQGKESATPDVYEIIDGKVALAGYVNGSSGVALMEVIPGKHTYFRTSSCEPYTIEIDAEIGNVYIIKATETSKNSIMSYCHKQGALANVLYPSFGNKKFHEKIYIHETKKLTRATYYTLNPRMQVDVDKVILTAGLQKKYDSYKEDMMDFPEALRRKIPSDKGVSVIKIHNVKSGIN